MQEIGPARGEQFPDLVDFNGPLKNDPSGAEIAASRRPDAVLADISHRMFEHTGAALRARTERNLAREVHFFGVCVSASGRSEVELGTEIRR
jgi:hypothetical protein